LYNWFESLPVAVVVKDKYFLVHGGISSKVKLRGTLDRNMIQDLLWSDPTEIKREHPNERGYGLITFGPDITNSFLKKYNLETIVRSHQPGIAPEGFSVQQNGKILTISSTTVYGGKAAVLIIDSKKPAMNAYELAKGIRLI
ncbi:serine/threonine protein phosphatase, partial [Candidatus Woesearchaeota archaeon]|nr:serine/threonine protein phosphatase [Candidatus Woesearchaeota archaeon]